MSAVLQEKANNTALPFEVKRIAGRIGAELTGIKLSGDLSPETYKAIRAALLEHRVIDRKSVV